MSLGSNVDHDSIISKSLASSLRLLMVNNIPSTIEIVSRTSSNISPPEDNQETRLLSSSSSIGINSINIGLTISPSIAQTSTFAVPPSSINREVCKDQMLSPAIKSPPVPSSVNWNSLSIAPDLNLQYRLSVVPSKSSNLTVTKIELISLKTNELGDTISSERTGELAPIVRLIETESEVPLESVTTRLILTGPGGK